MIKNIYDFYVSPDEYKRASKLKISMHTVNVRIRKFGWDKEKALTTPTRPLKDKKKWVKIAEANGISKNTFYARVRNGWSYTKASTTKPLKHAGAQKKFTDDVYKKLKLNNISKATFYYRIKMGWTVEKACIQKVLSKEEIIVNLLQSNRTEGSLFYKARR